MASWIEGEEDRIRKRKLEIEEERRRGGWKGKRKEGRENSEKNIDDESDEEAAERRDDENEKFHIAAYTDNSQVFSVSSQGNGKLTGSLTVSNGTFRIPLTGDVVVDRGVTVKGKMKVAGRLHVVEGVKIGGPSGGVCEIEEGGISVTGRNGYGVRPLLSLSTIGLSQDRTHRQGQGWGEKEGEGEGEGEGERGFNADEEGDDKTWWFVNNPCCMFYYTV